MPKLQRGRFQQRACLAISRGGNVNLMLKPQQSTGIVAIGRNEGQRLRTCLESALRETPWIVYVDSASVDGSAELARSMGVDVIELDSSRAYTAARSRNAGIARLKSINSQVSFVQVIDSDCELVSGWLDAALHEIQKDDRVAVVCGRRRERHPDASIYNTLCDMEWNTETGEARACGGDALIRVAALDQIGGYDAYVIAGEEPEMCVRLRQAGWRILRIDRDMTMHDARMTSLAQWWRRTVRSGHAYAEGFHLHGRAPVHHFRKQVKSAVFWGVLLPLLALSLAWITWGASLLLLLGYVVLWRRVRRYRLQRGDAAQDAGLYANYCVMGKFAEVAGMTQYLWNRVRGKRTNLIEYHSPSPRLHGTPAAQGVRP